MGNSASSLPYTIGKQTANVGDGWELHQGSQKSDGSAVGVFVAKKPTLTKTVLDKRSGFNQLPPALHHFQTCKRLRHPHILQVLATLDTDNPTDGTTAAGMGSSDTTTKVASETGDLIIVTEPCVPLSAWLEGRPDPEQIAWGLEAVVRALHFLHASASLSHGNVSPASLFVTPAGDVKLWNFSLVTSVAPASGGLSLHFKDYEGLLTPDPYRSPERQEGRWDVIESAGGVHAMDAYSVGVLIGDLFSSTPPPLVKAVQRLLTPNVKMRPRLQPILKCPIFDTPYQKLQLQLEEFAVAAVEQKIGFWNNLTPQLQAGLIPETLAVYKLIPMMKQSLSTICQSDSLRTQDMYRREVAAVMQPMFFIAEHYLDDRVGAELGPTVALLFTVADRGIRGALLQKTTLLVEHLDKHTLNTAVFEPACSGFSDSSAALRELTLKATLIMVPNLTHPNLEKLSRYLVRLQSDPEASIRTNTVLFFSKLAPYLTDMSRQKLLLPAYIRAMNDSFTPCRLAALKSTLKSKEFFDPKGIASKVLPAVTPQLLDPAAEVRREAFQVVDDLLFLLRQEGERLNTMPDQTTAGAAAAESPAPKARAPTTAPSPAVSPAPASGGYLSGLSSWMASSARASTPPPKSASASPAPKASTPQVTAPAPPAAAYVTANMAAMSVNESVNVSDGWGDDGEDDGWGDDDDDLGNVDVSPIKAPTSGPARFSAAVNEDPFSAIGAAPAKTASLSMRKAKGKLTVPGSKTAASTTGAAPPRPAVTKLDVSDDDGWDDF